MSTPSDGYSPLLAEATSDEIIKEMRSRFHLFFLTAWSKGKDVTLGFEGPTPLLQPLVTRSLQALWKYDEKDDDRDADEERFRRFFDDS